MEEFFTRKMKERLNRLELVSLREISEALGLTQYSKKNKSEIIEDICSVCFFQSQYESSEAEESSNDFSFFDSLSSNEVFFPNLRTEPDKISGKKIVSYELTDELSESKVRASSPVVEYKIVGVDGKEKKAEERSPLLRREREVVKYQGFIEQIDDEFKIVTISSNEVYEISPEDKVRWDIERYDTIGFNRYWSLDANKYLAKIISVNGRDFKTSYSRKNIDTLKRLKPCEEFDFSANNNICTLLSAVYPIKKGERVLVSTSENNGKKRIATEIAKNFKNKGAIVFAIYPNSMIDGELVLEEVDKNATFISDGISPLQAINKTAIAFMRARKFVEEGKDVVIIMGGLDSYCQNIYDVVGTKAEQNICKFIDSLFRNGGVYENGGAMTIISVIGLDNEILIERLKTRFNFYAPLKDADMSLFPQVDFKNIKINKINGYDE